MSIKRSVGCVTKKAQLADDYLQWVVFQNKNIKREVGHKWAWWLHHPYNMGGPQHFKAGDKNTSGPQVGRLATQPLTSGGGGSTLQSGGQNRRWPTTGASGDITPAVLGSPTLQGGRQNQKWPTSGPGGNITPIVWESPTLQSGVQNQNWLTSGPGGCITLSSGGSPTLQSGGHNQNWPTNGPSGYITPAIWGSPPL